MAIDIGEAPRVPLAKVEKREEERKKGGFFWWLRSGKTLGELARGGAGMAGAGGMGGVGVPGWLAAIARLLASVGLGNVSLATFLTKALIAMIIAALCASAYNFGRSLNPSLQAAAQPAAPGKPFLERERKASRADMRSGLGLAGKIDDPAAQQAAAAAPSADASKQDPSAGAPGAPDAAAGGAADAAGFASGVGAEEAGKAASSGGFSQKYGALSSGLGGGASRAGATLAGGAGMSSGVSRSFDSLKMGRSQAFARTQKVAKTAARAPVRAVKGKAFKQLARANTASQAARATGVPESAQTSADAPFTNNAPLNQTVANPPGMNGTSTGGGSGVTNTPTPTNPTTGGGGGGSGPTGVDPLPPEMPNPNAANVTPWAQQGKMAAMALMAGIVCLLIASVVGKIEPYGRIASQILGGIAAMCGALAIAMGMQMMGMGPGAKNVAQMYLGAGGLLVAGGAVVALMPHEGAVIANLSVPQLIGLATAGLAGLLTMKAVSVPPKLD